MSGSGYVIPLDPSELASRFPAASDPRFEDDEFWDDDEGSGVYEIDVDDVAELFSSSNYEDQIVPLLDMIPEREADLIHLYFIQRKRQADIAEIFKVTQAAVSYRLDRGIKRLQYLLSIPHVTEDDLRGDLPRVFPNEVPCPKCSEGEGRCSLCGGTQVILVDVEILVGMWRTTCQSEVAVMLNLTQGRVRHRFFKAVDTLLEAAEKDETLDKYAQIFGTISKKKKFNILREVKLPQWSGRGGDECF